MPFMGYDPPRPPNPFMGYDPPRPPNPSEHAPNCKIVADVLIFEGLPSRLSPHSFRVTAITDLLT
jgi:hypothetical protein